MPCHRTRRRSRQCALRRFLGHLLVVVGLAVEPHLGRPAEVAFDAQGGIDGDSPLALDDFIDAPGRDSDVLSDPAFRQPERDQEVFAEDFTGMNGSVCFHG